VALTGGLLARSAVPLHGNGIPIRTPYRGQPAQHGFWTTFHHLREGVLLAVLSIFFGRSSASSAPRTYHAVFVGAVPHRLARSAGVSAETRMRLPWRSERKSASGRTRFIACGGYRRSALACSARRGDTPVDRWSAAQVPRLLRHRSTKTPRDAQPRGHRPARAAGRCSRRSHRARCTGRSSAASPIASPGNHAAGRTQFESTALSATVARRRLRVATQMSLRSADLFNWLYRSRTPLPGSEEDMV